MSGKEGKEVVLKRDRVADFTKFETRCASQSGMPFSWEEGVDKVRGGEGGREGVPSVSLLRKSREFPQRGREY